MKESRKYRQIRWIYHETRPIERLREQYILEKRLATKLKTATKEERKGLYTEVYDELLTAYPDNHMLARKYDKVFQARQIHNAMQMLKRIISKNTVFLELGPGDCSLSLAMCEHVKHVHAVDVSHEMTKGLDTPENFELVISDGTSIPIDKETVDVAYSNQFMEHIHPEDVVEQLDHIYASLRPGGVYLCRTPNALSGPHDISAWFDDEPKGMHLKEYTYGELNTVFRKAGFRSVRVILGARGYYLPFSVPSSVLIGLEGFLRAVPFGKSLAHFTLMRAVLGMQVLAIK